MVSWTHAILIQEMACRLLGPKPLPKLILTHCDYSLGKHQRNFNPNTLNLFTKMCLKCCVCRPQCVNDVDKEANWSWRVVCGDGATWEGMMIKTFLSWCLGSTTCLLCVCKHSFKQHVVCKFYKVMNVFHCIWFYLYIYIYIYHMSWYIDEISFYLPYFQESNSVLCLPSSPLCPFSLDIALMAIKFELQHDLTPPLGHDVDYICKIIYMYFYLGKGLINF